MSGAPAAVRRNNVTLHGPEDGQPMLFAHGFGCDQNMWRQVWPEFAAGRRVILFDHVGAGGSDWSAHDRVRHGSLQGYADDILDIVHELDLRDVIFVGHSVAAMMGVRAAIQEPERFADLVLVGPSPRYIDADGYEGGSSAEARTTSSPPRSWAPTSTRSCPAASSPSSGPAATART